MKNVQVPQQLFMKLLRYHLLDDDSCADDVKKGLEQKMNTMVERELPSKVSLYSSPVQILLASFFSFFLCNSSLNAI